MNEFYNPYANPVLFNQFANATAFPPVQPAAGGGLIEKIRGIAKMFLGESKVSQIESVLSIPNELKGLNDSLERSYSIMSAVTDRPKSQVRADVEKMLKDPSFWFARKDQLRDLLTAQLAMFYVQDNVPPSQLAQKMNDLQLLISDNQGYTQKNVAEKSQGNSASNNEKE